MLKSAVRFSVPANGQQCMEFIIQHCRLHCDVRVLISVPNFDIALKVTELFKLYDVSVKIITNLQEVSKYKNKVFIGQCEIEHAIKWHNIIFIPYQVLIGRSSYQRGRSKRSNFSQIVNAARKLDLNTTIVHRDHGIGVFEGSTMKQIKGQNYELLQIRYQDGRIYVPTDKINLLTPHNHTNYHDIELDKISSPSWIKLKKSAQQKINLAAHTIIDMASKRALAKGPIYNLVDRQELVSQFENSFLYQETDDQMNAINDIFTDLQSGKPMDRLVYGDVGFGKTEVAMRALFLVTCGKLINLPYCQVAFLCPTILLAKQHFESLKARFKPFNISVELLSGSLAEPKVNDIHNRIAGGRIDILIGTSAILSQHIQFNNLGLIVCDEEQTFGVQQKESLRKNNSSVHNLTLSATPIPRTLCKALSGIQDISIISTSPAERISIKTSIIQFSKKGLLNIIELERANHGHVIVITPKIADIDDLIDEFSEIIPRDRIGVMHGEITQAKIQETQAAASSNAIDLIIATTIIGFGMDFANSNTIIINKPQMFGISQLHQIRGRVGRRNKQAYCYLLVDHRTLRNKQQMSRLEHIRHHSTLGSGLEIAHLDLEQRGGGNLISTDQSGSIEQVSVALYHDLLRSAIQELSGNNNDHPDVPEINIDKPIYIPEDYALSIRMRLDMYREISNLITLEDLERFDFGLQDRFGRSAKEIQNLRPIVRLRHMCNKYCIVKLNTKSNLVLLWLSKNHLISIEQLVLHTANSKSIKIRNNNILEIKLPPTTDPNLDDVVDRIECSVMEWMAKLAKD